MSERAPKGGRCSICGAPIDPAMRPFCSKRCADIDLARWMSGTYVVPGGVVDDDEDGDSDNYAQNERSDVPPDKLH